MLFNIVGQVPAHVPAPQVQGLGSTIGNIQSTLVPPALSATNQTPIEDTQQPLEGSANDNQLENNYVDDTQNAEQEPQEQQEPGK